MTQLIVAHVSDNWEVIGIRMVGRMTLDLKDLRSSSDMGRAFFLQVANTLKQLESPVISELA